MPINLKKKAINIKNLKNILFSILVIIFITYIIKFPNESAVIVTDALKLCYTVIIPVIFPFLIFSRLLIRSSLFKFAGHVLNKPAGFLFGISGLYTNAFLIGSLLGFPMGAKTVRDIYLSDKSNKNQAERTLAFCNNCSISFVISVAGMAVFKSVTIGFILFFIQVISAVITGVIVRFMFPQPHSRKVENGKLKVESEKFSIFNLTEIISESVNGILNICGIVLFFFILINITAGYFKIFGLFDAQYIKTAVSGIFEVSSGMYSLVNFKLNIYCKLMLSSAILGWSGISVHFQIKYILKDTDLSLKPYFTGKVFHVIISVLITVLTFKFLPAEKIYAAVSSYNYYPADYFYDADNLKAYMNYLEVQGIVTAAVVFSILITALIFYLREKYKKCKM